MSRNAAIKSYEESFLSRHVRKISPSGLHSKASSMLQVLCLLTALLLFWGACVEAFASREWATPRLTSRLARSYRTELRNAARLGPNFNGHYRILSWGCGTACIYWSVINLESGEVWISAMVTDALPRIDEQGNPQWIDASLRSPTIRTYSIVDDAAICPRGTYREQTFVWVVKMPKTVSATCIEYPQ
jgi:hypothetical protein